jgi:hypothetical protein
VALPDRALVGYVNLRTKRSITKLGKPGLVYLDVSTISPGDVCYVVGTLEEINEFKAQNRLGPEYQDQDQDLKENGAVIKGPNVHDIPREQLQNICPFKLTLSGPGYVLGVDDGDTIKMAARVRIGDLTRPIYASGHKQIRYPMARSDHLEAEFDIVVTCRLMGIDFAEHDTIQGIIGTKLMNDLFKRYNYKVWFSSTNRLDAHNRQLVHLYGDERHNEYLNTHFIGKMITGHDPTGKPINYGHFVEAYDGGKKSDYMLKLPKLSLEEQAVWKKYIETLAPEAFGFSI